MKNSLNLVKNGKEKSTWSIGEKPLNPKRRWEKKTERCIKILSEKQKNKIRWVNKKPLNLVKN